MQKNNAAYTVLIADDEKDIREGLIHALDWDAAGFRLVSFAADGAQALELFSASPTDAAVLDIKMPFMSGLDVLAAMKRISPETEIILLTAFDDFEFAKQGLKMGAFDYILKMNVLDELPEAVGRLKTKLDASRRKQTEHNNLLNSNNNKMFAEFLNGTAEEFDTSGDGYYYIVAVTPASEAYGEFGDFKSRTPFLMGTKRGNKVFIFKSDRADTDAAGELTRYMRRMCGDGERYAVGFGSVRSGIKNIPACYREAMKALDYARYHGEYGEFYFDRLTAQPGAAQVNAAPPPEFNILALNAEKLREAAQSLLEYYMHDAASTVRDYRLHLLELLFRMKKAGTVSFADVNIIVERINGIDSMPELNEYYIAAVTEGIKNAELIKSPTSNDIMAIKKYVDEHYNEDVNMEELARRIFLSPQYFSKKFKECVGVNFSDYVIERRIECACQMLVSTKLRVYEIGEKVGYRDHKYFERLFSSKIGVSPAKYRKNQTK